MFCPPSFWAAPSVLERLCRPCRLKLHISCFSPSTSISIPKVDNEPQFIHIKQPFADVTEDIKAMIPRHLRKPWKLLHKANYGSREEHLNAVRELSNVTHNLRY